MIKLTKIPDLTSDVTESVSISIKSISLIGSSDDWDHSVVHFLNGSYIFVKESPKEIEKLLAEARNG
jgi:hypothetical protein